MISGRNALGRDEVDKEQWAGSKDGDSTGAPGRGRAPVPGSKFQVPSFRF